jgi:hypothetical protein
LSQEEMQVLGAIQAAKQAYKEQHGELQVWAHDDTGVSGEERGPGSFWLHSSCTHSIWWHSSCTHSI